MVRPLIKDQSPIFKLYIFLTINRMYIRQEKEVQGGLVRDDVSGETAGNLREERMTRRVF